MAGDNVRQLVYEFLGKPGDHLPEHTQTVKISATAHAKLRALADLVGRSKTPLLADLVTAAINDAIEALPNDPLDGATADKLRGVVSKADLSIYTVGNVEYAFEPRGMREIVLERADNYLALDQRDRDDEQLSSAGSETSSKNGVHK